MRYTARQMGRQAEETELPVAVVSDGKLLPHGLAQAGKSRDWVGGQLTAHGLSSVKQVFLLSVTKSGVTYFVPKEDGV